jgi:serine protease
MGTRRARFAISTVAVAGLLVFGVHGQQRDATPFAILEGVGLPAVDLGVNQEETHAPGTPEAIRRAAIRTAVRVEREADAPPSYAPGKVIVKFREASPDAERASVIREASPRGAMMDRRSHADFDIVRLGSDENPETVATALNSRAEAVEYAQPAYRVHTMMKPNDPLYTELQWNLPLINLEPAWDIQPAAGSTITVAVLDTGMAYTDAIVDATIPAFRDENRVLYPALGHVTIPYSAARQLVAANNPGRIVAPHDFIWEGVNPNTPLDFDGHGTHVSGTIGQITNDGVGVAGVAFNVKLMPIKVIDSVWDFLFGAPNEATDDIVARGIRYAADNGAKVINMSIGRSGPPAPVIEDAMNYAVGKGAFISVAAGNEFEDGNPKEVLADIASRIRGAVAVGAVDPQKSRSFYSSTGNYVELAAPGGSNRGFGRGGFVFQQTFDPRQTDTFLRPPTQYTAPRFDVMNYIGYIGTSMAAPHVSGIAAMLMQQGITSPAAIEAALERFAVDLGPQGRDDQYGFGLVDARNALRGLGLAK